MHVSYEIWALISIIRRAIRAGLKSNYAQRLPLGVDVPNWAAGSFNSAELAVLGVVRDTAYKTSDGACSLTLNEIARLAEVSPRMAVRAISVAIAIGVVERDERRVDNAAGVAQPKEFLP